MSGGFTFSVLGPLEVREDGRPVSLTAAKQRALLALLLLNANQVMTKERLLAELWGPDAPLTAPKMLQVLVFRVRRGLGLGSDDGLLETRPAGYAIRVQPDQLDILRFTALAAAGREQLALDPALAADRLAEALSLWHGAPLSDLADEPFAVAAVARLEEVRLAALEDRIEADLALGRHAAIVAELKDLSAKHPFRERLTAQLMLALYRSGRQAEALETYRTARALLVEQQGIDPSMRLQRLHGAILRQESSLDPPETRGRVGLPPVALVEETSAIAPSLPRRPRAFHRGLTIGTAAVATAIALVLLVTVIAFGLGSTNRAVVAESNSIAVVDAARGVVTGTIPVGIEPGPVVFADGSAWVGNRRDLTVSRVDLRSRTVVRTFGLADTPEGLTADSGVVWIINGFSGTLSRILTAYNQLSAPFFPGATVSGLVAAQAIRGDLWVGLSDNSVLRLDPSSLRVKSTFTVTGRARAIAVDLRSVWTIQFFDDEVKRIDPITGLVSVVVRLQNSTQAIVDGAGAIWVATSGDDRLWKIDAATAQIVASTPLGVPPAAIVATASDVWVASATGGVLEQIDPKAATLLRTIRMGHSIGGLAVAGNQLLLTVD